MSATASPPAEQKVHVFARERGVSPRLYACVRSLGITVLRLWFRVRVSGAEHHIPSDGPAIVAPNHKNFLDAFFVGIAIPRHVRYMAKVELFKGPLGWLFLRLGAFPVRRGEADAEALQTARAILAGGGLVVVSPRNPSRGGGRAGFASHHGAARLALQKGAPIIPRSDHRHLAPVARRASPSSNAFSSRSCLELPRRAWTARNGSPS